MTKRSANSGCRWRIPICAMQTSLKELGAVPMDILHSAARVVVTPAPSIVVEEFEQRDGPVNDRVQCQPSHARSTATTTGFGISSNALAT